MMLPAFAFMALWQYMDDHLAKSAMGIALRRPGTEDLVVKVEDALSDEGWRLREGVRLNNAFALSMSNSHQTRAILLS